MYATSELIEIVRRNLLDNYTTDVNVSGVFWQDVEILLALNVAQDVLTNFLLKQKLYTHLRHLHVQTVLGVGDTISGLTDPYLQYDSAKVSDGGDPAIVKMARIYIGGETEIYNIVKHRNLCIINDTYEFNYNRQTAEGIMYYFRRPTRISLGTPSPNIDYDDWIYKDAICNYAALLLGIKSVQTIRESYKQKTFFENLGVNPPFATIFLNNVEVKIQAGGRSE